MKTLNELKIGESGVIIKVNGSGRLRKRILDMGVTPGTEIFLRKVAPFGDPIEITLRGYELSLRKDEASLIELREIDSVNKEAN